MSESRFVLDTGVLVSALLLPLSVPRQAVDLAFAHEIVMVSAAFIDELNEVLRRPKFNRYLEEKNGYCFSQPSFVTPLWWTSPRTRRRAVIPRMTSSSNWQWPAMQPVL